MIPTQIRLQIPLGYYGRLASKSGLAILHQLHVGAGVTDPDYTGEIMVLLINTASRLHPIKRGDPIAQLILEKVSIPILKEVKHFHLLLGEITAVAFEMSICIFTRVVI